MAIPESQELQMRVDELISSTKKGSFQWRAVNPTTYLWEKQSAVGALARLTLQRVEQNTIQQPPGPGQSARMVRTPFVILQVFDIKPGTPQLPVLTISGIGNPSLNQKLQELFDVAASGISEHGLEFLKGLIPRD